MLRPVPNADTKLQNISIIKPIGLKKYSFPHPVVGFVVSRGMFALIIIRYCEKPYF